MCACTVLVERPSEQAQASSDPELSKCLLRAHPALHLLLAAGSFAGDALPTLFYLFPSTERITFCSAVQEMSCHRAFQLHP